MQVYDIRKLHFQANLCEVLLKPKAALLWRLSFRMGSCAKDCLQDFNRNVGGVL